MFKLTQIPPLTALLSLLTYLSYSLPLFSSFLLSPPTEDPDGDAPAEILVVLCDIIRNHISPSSATVKVHDNNAIQSLASSTIELMQSLCWNIPAPLEAQYVVYSFPVTTLISMLQAGLNTSKCSGFVHTFRRRPASVFITQKRSAFGAPV